MHFLLLGLVILKWYLIAGFVVGIIFFGWMWRQWWEDVELSIKAANYRILIKHLWIGLYAHLIWPIGLFAWFGFGAHPRAPRSRSRY